MTGVSLTPQRLALLVGLGWGLAALLFVVMPTELPVQPERKAGVDHWALPQPIAIGADEALSIINQRRLFGAAQAGLAGGAPAAKDDPPLTPPNWRIVGVFAEGKQRGVLVVTDGQPVPTILKEGDALPGGAKIIDIGSDRICILLNGKRVSLSTYRQ